MKILLVEDNRMIQDLLFHRLHTTGHTVLVADNGCDGIKIAVEERPFLILMDMSLPILDGWEATRQLKANPAVSHIPIIGLSGHSSNADRACYLQAGCDAFEPKPIKFDQLLETMERVARQYQ